ncbi:MAG: FecR domain-containing protein, partial [Planctomycetes bacterium]|nr:FecR domain-containing protein [Planctomycetota bacterium]
MDRFEALLSEYLDGSLDPAGGEELARLVESDPERLKELVDLVRENRILSVELGAAPEAFTKDVIADLEKDKTRFIRAVMTDVRGGGFRPSDRPRRLQRSGGAPGPVWVMWAAIAAGALVVVGLLLHAVGGDSEPAPRQVRRDQRKPVPLPEPKSEEPLPPPPPKPEEPKPPAPAPKPELPPPVVPIPEKPVKPETPAPKPDPVVPKPEPTTTVLEVALLERLDGEVSLTRGGQKKPAQTGEALLAGDILEAVAAAVVKYADGTRVELRAGTMASFPASDAGKRIVVDRGIVRAQVARQPAGLPMLFASLHADATVLGTTLRLAVDPDPKEGTRLDVEEGKVKLLRKLDGKSVEVATGHYAVVATGIQLVSKLARVTAGLQALYTFKEGRGGVVRDLARVGAPIDLKIENEQAVRWSPRGLLLVAPTLVASPSPATRIAQACKQSNEVSLELWIRPATLTPAAKDGRIFSFSSDILNQNFMIGQDEFKGPNRSYFVRLRSTATDPVGKPDLASPDGGLTLKLTHLVYTRATSGAAALYLDGAEIAKTSVGGSFASWNDGFRIGLGNEFSNDRAWLGEYHYA